MTKINRDIQRKLRILNHAEQIGDVSNACRYFVVGWAPQLNGKVERSHRTDEQEFYQLLTYTDDVDLREKLAEWEKF